MSLIVKFSCLYILNSYYKTSSVSCVCIVKMTRKEEKELRTMDGNYEKNEKTPPTSPLRHVNTENKKIEKCSIYGDSYFQMNIGEVANLAELTKTDSASNLETNSTNSYSSRLKNEDIKMPGTISARLCRAWFV